MHKDDLVTGMTFASSEKPDTVCEPCLAGKMSSNPFPSSPSRSTQPLELIHSDLHGPLPVPTWEGYRYWITFIDDATSYRGAIKLKQKSKKATHWMHSKCSSRLWRTNSMRKSKHCRMTRGENICPMHLSNSLMNVVSIGATQHGTGHSKTELLNAQIGPWQRIFQPCSTKRNCRLHSGGKRLPLKSMFGTAFLRRLSNA